MHPTATAPARRARLGRILDWSIFALGVVSLSTAIGATLLTGGTEIAGDATAPAATRGTG